MPLFLAISPTLLWFGPILLILGFAALTLMPFGRQAVQKMILTGAALTMFGLAPAIAVNGFGGAAYADETAPAASPAQQIMLSGMGSQIIYGIAE